MSTVRPHEKLEFVNVYVCWFVMWYWDCGPDVSKHPACSQSCQHLRHKCVVLRASSSAGINPWKKEYIVDHYLAARKVLWHLKQQCGFSNARMATRGKKKQTTPTLHVGLWPISWGLWLSKGTCFSCDSTFFLLQPEIGKIESRPVVI